MRILWCQEHDSQKQPDRVDGICWAKTDWVQLEGDCRMVPMRLIPDNAETVLQIAKAIVFSDGWENDPGAEMKIAEAVLAALDGETP